MDVISDGQIKTGRHENEVCRMRFQPTHDIYDAACRGWLYLDYVYQTTDDDDVRDNGDIIFGNFHLKPEDYVTREK